MIKYNKELYNKIETSGIINSGIYPRMLDKLKNGDDIQELKLYLDYIIIDIKRLRETLIQKIED
jgi:hypothetical protein